MKRRGRLRGRSSTKRRAPRDYDYMAFVARLPCCVPDAQHRGRTHAHHAGVRGLGQRAADDTCIPLCAQHHQDYHDVRGLFRAMTKAERREWLDEQITETRSLYLASKGEL